jgi:hypothetical protein
MRACTQRGGWHAIVVLGLVTGLVACGTPSSQPPTMVFPGTASGSGVFLPGSGMAGIGQDPAETAAINPFDPIALNNLAVMEASKGRYQQAASLLQRAVRLAPARADIAANLSNLQRWLALAEGQAALGLQPQPLQLPYQEAGVPEVPPLWMAPPATAQVNRPSSQPFMPSAANRPPALTQPDPVPRLSPAPALSKVPSGSRSSRP